MQEIAPIHFGKYDLLGRLSSEGVGELFVAGEAGLGGYARHVVIQMLSTDRLESSEMVDRLIADARGLVGMVHANVVRIFEVGKVEGKAFIASEHVSGLPLADLMQWPADPDRAFTPRGVATLARGLALGLDHAHSAVDAHGNSVGMAHCAVNPQCAWIDASGNTKLTGFVTGYASTWLTKPQHRTLGLALPYLSPEQVRGDPPDARSDQYSLGVLAWELLARRSLFAGADPNETARRVIDGVVEPLTAAAPGCPPQLDAVVQRMLQRDPAARFGRCAEVAEALGTILSSTGGEAQPELARLAASGAPAKAADQEHRCGSCGSPQAAGAKFCSDCGAKIDPAGQAPAVATAPATTGASPPLGASPATLQPVSPPPDAGFPEPGTVITGGETVMDTTQSGAAVLMVDGQRYLDFGEEEDDDQPLELTVDRIGPGSQYVDTTFRDRTDELANIKNALEHALGGQIQRRWILGNQGVGKTRMLGEAMRVARELDFNVVHALGGRYGVPVAYDLFRQWVIALCARLSESGRGIEKMQRARVGEALGWVTAIKLPLPLSQRLTQLFDDTVDETVANALEHSQRLQASLVQFLWMASQATPLCLAADDVHLSDVSSLELLSQLSDRLPQSQIAVCVTGDIKLAERVPIEGETISLATFPNADAVHMAEDFLGHGVLPAELAQALQDGARGNPLLISHQMRVLIEAQLLRFEMKEWTLGVFDASHIVTHTKDFTVQRAYPLSPGALYTTRLSALAGDSFSRQLIEAAVTGQGINAREAIDDAMGCGLVVSLGQSRERQRFRQGCSRSHLLEDVDPEALRKMHYSLASSYAQHEIAQRSETAELVAWHLLAAQVGEPVLQYGAAAANKLLRQGARQLSAQMFVAVLKVGLEHAAALEQIPESLSAGMYKLCDVATGCMLQDNPSQASGLIARLLDTLPKDHAPFERARALRRRALALLAINRSADARVALEAAVKGLPPNPDPTLLSVLMAERALVLEAEGSIQEAGAQLKEALKHLGNATVPANEGLAEHYEFLLRCHRRLSRLYGKMERPDLALQVAQIGRELALRADMPLEEIRALMLLAGYEKAQGRVDVAVSLLNEAKRISEEIVDPWIMAQVCLELARLQSDTSKGNASELLQRATQLARLSGQTEVAKTAQTALTLLQGLSLD